MGASWNEIKLLASDFKNVQLLSTFHNLSEGNCVEVVSLLINGGLADIYFTNDGKEYVTQKQLIKEILSELDYNEGRVNMADVSRVLNVDFTKVENIVSEIVRMNSTVVFVVGQFIEENYIRRMAQEVNQIILKNGKANITELATQFDLPKTFFQRNVIEKYVGDIIQGHQDNVNTGVLFTPTYMEHCKLKVIGALTAITRPTAIVPLLKQLKVEEQLFNKYFADLSSGSYSNSFYLPNMFTDAQSEWIMSFYKQNGFLEYDTARKIGITKVEQFIRKHISKGDVVFLKNIAINSSIVNIALLSAINECILSKSYFDLLTILPTSMSDNDIRELMELVTALHSNSNDFVCFQTVVFSKTFLNNIVLPCFDLANKNAKTAIQNGSYQEYIMDDLFESVNKHDYTCTGTNKNDEHKFVHGNRQERYEKNKKGKKSYGTRAAEVADRPTKVIKAQKPLQLVKLDDMETILFKILEKEGLGQFAENITSLYYKSVNQKAIQTAKELYETTVKMNRQKNYTLLEQKLNTTLNYIRLYENGLKLFPLSVQAQLENMFLKSMGNDICNEITAYMAKECNIAINSTNTILNIEKRNKIAQDCLPRYKSAILELNATLSKSIHEFYKATESALKSCNMFVKKNDRRKDRLLILQHKEKLYQELSETPDHALVLHLTVLILFIKVTGCILHASGRFISQILEFILPYLKPEEKELLLQFSNLVLEFSQCERDSKDYDNFNEQLLSLQPAMKGIIKKYDMFEM